MVRTKKNELDVDFIGGLEPLTREEEMAITDYFQTRKLKPVKKVLNTKTTPAKRGKSIA